MRDSVYLYIRLLMVAFAIQLVGCASSSYLFTSNPPGASVYYVDPGNQKRFLMGSTPLSYSKGAVASDAAFLVSVEKEGFQVQEIPIAPTDELRTVVSVNLKPDPTGASKTNREMNLVVSTLFKAQQHIYRRQYQAAIIELDKVLREKPDLIQALIMKGTAYFLLKEMPSATTAWKQALKIEPDNEELTRFLAENNIVLK